MHGLGRSKILWLYVIAAMSSCGQVLKYGGPYAVLGMLLGYFMVFACRGDQKLFAWIQDLPQFPKTLLGFSILIFLTVAIVEIYPIANSQTPGKGSDNDDAVAAGALSLVSGKNPYDSLTYLNNAPATFPASFYFAAPFAVAGHIELQNVFWVLAFLLILGYQTPKQSNGFGVLAMLLLFGGIALCQQLVTGSDRIANSLFVCAATIFVFRLLPDPANENWKLPLGCLGLGFVLASRINLAIVLVPLFVHAVGRKPVQTILTCGMALVLGFVLALIPVWPNDLQHFEPFLVLISKLTRHDSAPVWSLWLFRGLSVCGVVWCSLLAYRNDTNLVFWAMALSIAIPFLSLFCIASIQTQSIYTEYLDYLILSLPFALAAMFVAPDSPQIVSTPQIPEVVPTMNDAIRRAA